MRYGTTLNPMIAILSLGLGLIGCRSKLDVHAQSGAPAAGTEPKGSGPNGTGTTDNPVEMPTKVTLSTAKVYFQTRDTITVAVDRSVVDGAPTFTVLNVTNSGDDDSKAVTVLSEAVPTFGLVDSSGHFGLTEVDGDKVLLIFYPVDNDRQSKFFYGENTLKIVANDDANPRYGTVKLTIKDFDVFGISMTAFGDNTQVAKVDGANGYQFQGWLNSVSPPTVTLDAGDAMTTGVFNMVNPN